MNSLWQEGEFEHFCNRELLTEKATEIRKTISVKEHERERYDFDLKMLYENRFGNWRPDGIVINNNHQILYILEFKKSSDRNEDFLRVKEDEANDQYNIIIGALQAATPEWTFEQIYFVAGRHGSVVEDDFYNKLERLIDDCRSFIAWNRNLVPLLEVRVYVTQIHVDLSSRFSEFLRESNQRPWDCQSRLLTNWASFASQCTSRKKGQDSGSACATYMRSAWHSNALSANTWVVWGWCYDIDG